MDNAQDDSATSGSGPLDELAAATGRTREDLLAEGVDRLYRIYLGDPADAGVPTAPFSKKYSERPAEVVVRQVTPATFMLREPFKYVDRGRRFDVPEHDVSDFASVPTFLTWLIPRYGRHTLPALLHDHLQDHLVEEQSTSPSDPERVTSDEADTIFRQAMQYSRVPFIRRWVMWAAVSLRTVVKYRRGLPAVGAIAWVVLFGLLGLAWPIVALSTIATDRFGWKLVLLLVGAAVLLPIALCRLAGRRWRLSLISGLTLSVITFPCLLAIIDGGVYFAIEWVAERFQGDKADLIVMPRQSEGHQSPDRLSPV
jgi:hypothetical protein